MKQTNDELIRKFETMVRWMSEDTKRAMFQAKANFLVAQGLLNYSEVIGSFILPNGNSGERFDSFFSRMGEEYRLLLRRFNGRRRNNPHIVYDDLRCGLTHEYAIKRKKFIVYNHGGGQDLTDNQIDNLLININGQNIRCIAGVIHSWEHNKGVWRFIDPKYWLDFRRAVEQYLTEVRNPHNRDLRRSFFNRARTINFLQFSV
ncbi:hypothetical protein M1271_05695 [Patescibacteria group bacterium]|nr:hypothetical protein [Patescibacteria group bacterium]